MDSCLPYSLLISLPSLPPSFPTFLRLLSVRFQKLVFLLERRGKRGATTLDTDVHLLRPLGREGGREGREGGR